MVDRKLDQICYYAADMKARLKIKQLLGLEHATWISDTVTGDLSLPPFAKIYASRAFLEFNYDMGTEIEILTYLEGPHWHQENAKASFLSHQGIHVSDFFQMDAPMVQTMRTTGHTNRYLIEKKRTFMYHIYDTRRTLGLYTKQIKRYHHVGP